LVGWGRDSLLTYAKELCHRPKPLILLGFGIFFFPDMGNLEKRWEEKEVFNTRFGIKGWSAERRLFGIALCKIAHRFSIRIAQHGSAFFLSALVLFV
jgi:hypothetical protein